MLEELAAALDSAASDAGRDDYRDAIVDADCRSKSTAAARVLSRRRLSELYGLDPRSPPFRVSRRLWPLERVREANRGEPIHAVGRAGEGGNPSAVMDSDSAQPIILSFGERHARYRRL